MQNVQAGRCGISVHCFSEFRLKTALLLVLACVCATSSVARTTNSVRLEDYEGRLITAVELAFENSPPDSAAQAEFLSLLRVVAGTEFSAVRARESLQALLSFLIH